MKIKTELRIYAVNGEDVNFEPPTLHVDSDWPLGDRVVLQIEEEGKKERSISVIASELIRAVQATSLNKP